MSDVINHNLTKLSCIPSTKDKINSRLLCNIFCLSVKLNGGRKITGILRGFDPFMNLVVDETIEETKTGEKHAIGMVVSWRPSRKCLCNRDFFKL